MCPADTEATPFHCPLSVTTKQHKVKGAHRARVPCLSAVCSGHVKDDWFSVTVGKNALCSQKKKLVGAPGKMHRSA